MFDIETYVAETKAFMMSACDKSDHIKAGFAIDRMRYLLIICGGHGKPKSQVIDTKAVKISLTWENGDRSTTIEVSDAPDYIVTWTYEGATHRLMSTLSSVAMVDK